MDAPRPECPHPETRASGSGVAASAAASAGLVYPTITGHNSIAGVLAEHAAKHRDLPVRGVRRFLKDVVVVKKSAALFDSKGRPQGAIITEFSHQSRMRLLHTAKNCGVQFSSMATLTYPAEFPRDGRQVKEHDLKGIIRWFRRNFSGVLGLWFLEFQKRGAPHFHILLDIIMQNYGDLVERRRKSRVGDRASYKTLPEMEQALAAAWYRIVGSGDEKHLRAGVSWEVLELSDAAIRYAAKHAAKPRQKEVPAEYFNVGKFWGRIGEVRAVELTEDVEEMTTEQLFEEFGYEAMSSKGKVKKYLWDANKLTT